MMNQADSIPDEALDEDFWRRKTRDLWNDENPETDEEIFDWYGSYDTYLAENMIRQSEVVDDIRQVYYWLEGYAPDNRVLDYGGGVGDFSIFLSEMGYDVVYSDVLGSFPELVERRVDVRPGCDVDVRLLTSHDRTPSDVVTDVDAAVCLEVIEHLPDPEAVIDGFAKVLPTDGVLVTSWTFSDWSDDPDDVYTPCHINTGRDRSREVADYMSLYFEETDYTWNKQMRLWRRK